MFKKIPKKLEGKHIIFLCQILILTSVLFIYILNRNNPYQKVFSWNEVEVTDNVTVTETITADAEHTPGGVFMTTSALSLDKGIYRIQVDYSTDTKGSQLSASCSQTAAVNWHCIPMEFAPNNLTTYLTLELTQPADDVVITASFSGSGYLDLQKLAVYETSDYYKQNLFKGVLLCLLLSFLYYFWRSDRTRRETILCLSGIFFISCYPLFTDYLVVGHDIPFHLLRIEGIAAGLSQGIFPVKIHPVWAYDYGYAVGVFYGDFALYFPAILRLLGFSVQTAYQYFVALIHLATVAVSYFTFKRMFHSRNIGLLGSLLYSLSLYRLADTYTRASVGEYTALLFLPMVFCGFYLIFMESDKENWWKHTILTALGMTGLIQSHILSCEMVVLFLILTCLILIRLVIKPYQFLALSSSTILTVLLNLGFLVPFFNYFNENIMILSPEWTGGSNGNIQNTGMFPLQIFSLFQRSNGGTWSTEAGINNETTFGMGIVFLIGMCVFIYLLVCHRKACAANRNFLPACLSFGLGCLALWMSTCYFPWNQIAQTSEIAKSLINSLQFPWRMLSPATVLITFVCCFAFSQITTITKENHSTGLIYACIVMLLVNIGWYFYDFCFTGTPYRVYDTHELYSMTMYSYDYLPSGTNPELITAGKILSSEGTAWDTYQKEGTQLHCFVTTGRGDNWIDFPLNYYEHYTCRVLETGENLDVIAGTNNMVRVSLPENFSGTLDVHFKEPLHWRLSELVSLITLISILGIYVCKLKNAKGGNVI